MMKERKVKIKTVKVWAIDVTYNEDGTYTNEERWMKATMQEIHSSGYLLAKGYVSSWKLLFAKVYIRFHGFGLYELLETDCQDTSQTLDDYSRSTATKDFIKHMKAQISDMDTKRFVVMALAAAAIAIVGFFLMQKAGLF